MLLADSPKRDTAKAEMPAQTGNSSVIVNGRKLAGPNSTAQSRGNRILVPVKAIAHAFGDRSEFSSSGRSFRIDRRDGTQAVFDASSGQVRENNVAVLSISNLAEITFPTNAAELLLPIEIASALFAASMRYDIRQNAVIVTRGATGPVLPTTKGRRTVELYRADYDVNASGFSGSVAQNLTLTAAGRVGDGRFSLRTSSSGTKLGSVGVRNFTADLERPNGQRFVAGDLGAATSLPLIMAQIRGGSASIPLGDVTITAFGGRAISGSMTVADPVSQVLTRPRYDTSVYGVSAARGWSRLGLAAGAMRFDGSGRAGQTATASANYTSRRIQLQADVGFGRARGLTSDGKPVNGNSVAIDLTGTYQVTARSAVYGRFAEIGRNFLTPQAGIREPLSLRAAGASYSPVSWLTASLNASTARPPGDSGRGESFVTAAVGIAPTGLKPRFYVSHTASSSRLYRSGAFTLLNASKEFSRWRLFLTATRIKTIGAANANVQLGANVSISDIHSLEASQGFGSRRSMNGMIDWRMSNLLGQRLSLTAGVGYNSAAGSRSNLHQRVTTSLRLPRETSLQVSYTNTVSGAAVLVQLRGAIFKRRNSADLVHAPLNEVNSLGSITGRVYQDVDGNGTFEPGVDKAQADVKVRVDGNRYALTDANGVFSFDAVPAGMHNVYLDLLSVRADLTIVDGSAREIDLAGGRTSGMDFRLVRTGRISGRVFFDSNGNGILDDGESPLADVRIVTSSSRDTLTDADGYFVIADLSPGEHTILIDEKTLPEKVIAGTRPAAVQVFAGKETDSVYLSGITAPAEVKRFRKQN